MRLSSLRPTQGTNKRAKRRGCGPGSGHGKTSCRGHKGAGQHSSSARDARFEGGQMPLYRRVPKRGFHNLTRVEYQVVNVSDVAGLGADSVTLDLLRQKRLVQGSLPVKLLGEGTVDKPLTVACHAFSKSARDKIEAAGGKLEVIKA